MNSETTPHTRQTGHHDEAADAPEAGSGRNGSLKRSDATASPGAGQQEQRQERRHHHGESEPNEHAQRDGSTQPNFGQTGTYGKQQHIEAQQRAIDGTEKR
ncbi:hypothetical protein [Xanthomonas melonis]|uniref:hypothetical protein n=1 Tax=Xanthomonas melonis TaxID=56456 RepID=UPI000CEE4D2C|nr:hypothetical protein [Xanthomonas melonis]MCC4601180.1 hypothetical protein [Xanthomonas melonis]MCD0246507.1 hypothetical protein [Xanthomonas melonis]